ncbi:MAG: DUF3137 domain-containing protein [Eubacterium sp.]|nr:DUF3137 domain-containing protein [Eubacterium sp.]
MDLSAFRKRLNNGEIDQVKLEYLRKENYYFASISPKSIFDNFKMDFSNIKERISGKTVMIIGIVLLLLFVMPRLFFRGVYSLSFIFIIIALSLLFSKSRGTPEYRQFDYRKRIVEPSLKLFDEKMSLGFHFDRSDLVDEELSYDNALVEARMVKPIKKRSSSQATSTITYDWQNSSNTDSFEYTGYKLYYEWEDDDGNKHEDVFFNGTIFKFHTSFTIKGSVNIMSTNTKQKVFGGEKEVNQFKRIKDKDVVVIDTENHEFAENFDTIATYDNEAYRFLTPTMIETLLELRKEYFFCICLKGNVMTVTLDNKGFKYATRTAISESKPYFASKDPDGDLNKRIVNERNLLLSIYEFKDMLDPNGRCAE